MNDELMRNSCVNKEPELLGKLEPPGGLPTPGDSLPHSHQSRTKKGRAREEREVEKPMYVWLQVIMLLVLFNFIVSYLHTFSYTFHTFPCQMRYTLDRSPI